VTNGQEKETLFTGNEVSLYGAHESKLPDPVEVQSSSVSTSSGILAVARDLMLLQEGPSPNRTGRVLDRVSKGHGFVLL
jgi:hypothetical protein